MRPNRPWLLALLLATSFIAGGLTPASAGTTTAEDAIIRQLEKIADSLHELAHREVRVVCECRGST